MHRSVFHIMTYVEIGEAGTIVFEAMVQIYVQTSVFLTLVKAAGSIPAEYTFAHLIAPRGLSVPQDDRERHNPALQRGLLFLWIASFSLSWCQPVTAEDCQSHPKRSQCAPDTEGSSTKPLGPSSRCV
jgi:hypothetical protein